MKLLRRPMKLFDKVQKHGKGSIDLMRDSPHKDGGPSAGEELEYTPNQALEEALIEELQNGPDVSLTAISASLAQNIDPNIPDRSNSSNRPLHYGAKFGNAKLIALLLDAGANIDQVNILGQTPLMIACAFTSRRHFACAELLISRACNINLRDKGGSNALEQAITASNVACVRSLLDHGARLASAPDDRRVSRASMSCTLFEQPDETSVLALAESIRARSIGMEPAEANAYFAELEVNGGPSFLDKMLHKRLCSPSHEIVICIREHSSLFSSLEVHARTTQKKPPRRPKRKWKTAISIRFVAKIRLLARKFMGRKRQMKRPSSVENAKNRHHRTASRTTSTQRRNRKKSKASHEQKSQPQAIDKEMDGTRYRRRSNGRRVDGRKSEVPEERRSTNDKMPYRYSRSGRRSTRPPNERQRRRRKEDRIRRKRESAPKTR